jgi:hypothetical protein
VSATDVQARKVAPGDVIARRRPHRAGGGFVPAEVTSTAPSSVDGMVVLAGQGWSWGLAPRRLVTRLGRR